MLLQGDCLELMKTLPDKSVQTCVTSPPYWGLRDYGVEGQLGNKKQPRQVPGHADGTLRTNLHKIKASDTRNKRSVWSVTTKPFKGAHFAVMPEKLVEPCILAGSKEGDLILDPFCGSGTVGVVAQKLGRQFVGTELNPEYVKMAEARLLETPVSLFNMTV